MLAPTLAGEPRGLVVIAPAEFRAALEPLLAARATERPVEFLALESVALDSTAADGTRIDPPESIKRALYQRWREQNVGYALLVGDAETFPVRFMVLDRVTEPAFHTAFYPSDLYYADVAREDGSFDDWNASREGHRARYFGEVHGEHRKSGPINTDAVSYVPELAVGRFPVRDAAGTAALVAKTLAHAPAAAPRALIVHADGWIDARDRAGAMAASLASRGFWVEAQLFGSEPTPASATTDGSGADAAPRAEKPAYRSTGTPGPERVLGLLRAGVELALHLGHGSEQGWHDCLGPAEREPLLTSPPAVILSIGCSTAHFVAEPPYQAYLDERGVPHLGTNAGERFDGPPPPPHWLQPGRFAAAGFGADLVRAPRGGALVYIGCTTGAQPCALTLQEAFQEVLRTAQAPCVGDAWRIALTRYHERERLASLVPDDGWYPPSIFFQGMKFVFLGDPTLRL